MRTGKLGTELFKSTVFYFTRTIIIAGTLLGLAQATHASGPLPGGGTNSSSYTPLDSWSFHDPVGWTSDTGRAPVSFTNLNYSYLGSGSSLMVDTNVPAWLQYRGYETNGTTNLTVDAGTVMFWVAPGSWSSTNLNGSGPGVSGRLFEVGSYTPTSNLGWWSVYVDSGGNTLYFSAQTNDLSGTFTNYLAYPISWTTNYFHHVAITYCATNTALYLDGGLVTNGPPMTVYPGSDVLSNGFCIGSDTNGVYQSHALFNSVATYNTPLDAGTIQQTFESQLNYYYINPFNVAMFSLTNAAPSPDWTNGPDVISGLGNLTLVGAASSCNYGANADQVWFTNVTAQLATNGATSVTFTIQGGQPGYFYDVFTTAALSNPLTNGLWYWLGQGQTCNTYTISIISRNAFLILGTPLGTNGLTYAYLSLVAKVSPSGPQSDSYGVPYAWYAENGLVPIVSGLATMDPDLDGLLNYQEYYYGTWPNVSEGFSIWTSVGTTSIP